MVSLVPQRLYISSHPTCSALATKHIFFFCFVFRVVWCYYQLVGWNKCDIDEVPRLGSSKSDAKPGWYQKSTIDYVSECLASLSSCSILICYLRSYWCFQEHRERQSEDALKKLLFLDSIALSANVEALITDEDTYEELVETTGPGAQSLVNLLHAVCLPVICTSCYIDMSIQS